MIHYQRELLCEVAGEVDDLLAMHYQELTMHKDRIKLDPRWDEYTALERMGRLLVFTARCDGELIGYSAFFLNKHLHYAGTTVGVNDVLFLHPDHRKGTTGIRLIKLCESELKTLGADKIVWHAKLDTNLHHLLSHLGYAVEEVMYGKML